MKTVVFSLLGTQLDGGYNADRWNRWRPTVALFQQEDLLVDRFEFIHSARFKRLADTVSEDIARVSPETEIYHHEFEFADPWDFEEVYGTMPVSYTHLRAHET